MPLWLAIVQCAVSVEASSFSPAPFAMLMGPLRAAKWVIKAANIKIE
jgi:hypothetical protein